jgi:hypothetical protein
MTPTHHHVSSPRFVQNQSDTFHLCRKELIAIAFGKTTKLATSVIVNDILSFSFLQFFFSRFQGGETPSVIEHVVYA